VTKFNKKWKWFSQKDKDKEWDSGLKISEKCGHFKKALVEIPADVDNKVRSMMREFKGTEWLAYLRGQIFEENEEWDFIAVIDDLIVPEQEVSYASVEVKKYPDDEEIIGSIHSHHNMGSFLSSTDETYLVGNHRITLVISDKNNYVGKMRATAPCGDIVSIEAEVVVIYPNNEEFVREAKKKITHKTIVTYVSDTHIPGSGYDWNSHGWVH